MKASLVDNLAICHRYFQGDGNHRSFSWYRYTAVSSGVIVGNACVSSTSVFAVPMQGHQGALCMSLQLIEAEVKHHDPRLRWLEDRL